MLFKYRSRAAGLDVDFPQWGQSCGSLSCLNRMWKRRLLLLWYVLSQMWHWNNGIFSFGSLCTTFACALTAFLFLNAFPQCWHKNGRISSVSLLLLWIRVKCVFSASSVKNLDKNLQNESYWLDSDSFYYSTPKETYVRWHLSQEIFCSAFSFWCRFACRNSL